MVDQGDGSVRTVVVLSLRRGGSVSVRWEGRREPEEGIVQVDTLGVEGTIDGEGLVFSAFAARVKLVAFVLQSRGEVSVARRRTWRGCANARDGEE